jgi:hypothetical protein
MLTRPNGPGPDGSPLPAFIDPVLMDPVIIGPVHLNLVDGFFFPGGSCPDWTLSW